MAVIKLLKECPDYVSILGFWAYMEWYKDKSPIPFDIVIKSFDRRKNESVLPVSWVALENGLPVGMVSLKDKDLWSKEDITPWLTSLFVLPEFREKGIASDLIKAVLTKTAEFGFNTLYLFVANSRMHLLEKYYKDKGWKDIGDARGNEGETVKLFSCAV